MLITVKHDGFTHANFDTEDSTSMDILEQRLGTEKFQEVMLNLPLYEIKKPSTNQELDNQIIRVNESVAVLTADIEITTIGLIDVDNKVTATQEDTMALFDGVIEADNKATAAQEDAIVLFDGVIEADNKATSAQADTVALFDGLVDVDTRLSLLEADLVKTAEFVKLQQTVNDLAIKVNKIVEHLNLTI